MARVWIACMVLAMTGWAGSAVAEPERVNYRIYAPQELIGASSVWVDPDASATLDDVRRLDAQGRFQPLKTLFGAGYVPGAYWLKLELQADVATPRGWWLQINPPYLDDVRVTQVLPDGRAMPEQLAGDRVINFNTVHRTPTFALDLEPGLSTVYVRVESTSSISILPSLMPMPLAPITWQREYLLLGLYIGLEIALVVAAVLGAVMLRQRVYVYFAAFIVAGALQRFTIRGLAHQWWFDANPLLGDTIASSLIGVTAALGAIFFSELFEYRRFHRWLHRVIAVTGVYMILTALAPLLGVFQTLAKGAMALMLVNLVLMSVPLLRNWRTGKFAARCGVLGFVAYVVFVLLDLVSLLGFIPPSPDLLRTAQAGSIVLLFMLLLILLLQTTRAQRDRTNAQEIALQARASEERQRQAREEQAHLTAMIAHEIRTPVAVIDAALQSLKLLDENTTPERALRHERIGRAIQRMNTLMELALAQDRLEVSEWTQRLSVVDLASLTRDVLAGLGPAAEGRALIDQAAQAPLVQADKRMLQYVLLNLMDNALKYSPRDSQIHIAILPCERAGTPGCLWSIEDHGPGIPASDHDRVFQKYYRAAETTATPGLGLGLYIVRQIVNRHQGEVGVGARPSGVTGTRFECWLPSEQREN